MVKYFFINCSQEREYCGKQKRFCELAKLFSRPLPLVLIRVIYQRARGGTHLGEVPNLRQTKLMRKLKKTVPVRTTFNYTYKTPATDSRVTVQLCLVSVCTSYSARRVVSLGDNTGFGVLKCSTTVTLTAVQRRELTWERIVFIHTCFTALKRGKWQMLHWQITCYCAGIMKKAD